MKLLSKLGFDWLVAQFFEHPAISLDFLVQFLVDNDRIDFLVDNDRIFQVVLKFTIWAHTIGRKVTKNWFFEHSFGYAVSIFCIGAEILW